MIYFDSQNISLFCRKQHSFPFEQQQQKPTAFQFKATIFVYFQGLQGLPGPRGPRGYDGCNGTQVSIPYLCLLFLKDLVFPNNYCHFCNCSSLLICLQLFPTFRPSFLALLPLLCLSPVLLTTLRLFVLTPLSLFVSSLIPSLIPSYIFLSLPSRSPCHLPS